MPLTITITDAEGGLDQIIDKVVAALIAEHSEKLKLLTPSQVCGILNITPKSLGDMKLPKVDLLNNGQTIRYRVKDIEEALAERTIRQAKKRR